MMRAKDICHGNGKDGSGRLQGLMSLRNESHRVDGHAVRDVAEAPRKDIRHGDVAF
jgi:hypothetical protein